MNIVGDDFLRESISQDGYFLKLTFHASAAHFFPYTTEHRDASLPGLSYRDDSAGNALAATIKPTQIDIRLHNSFSAAQIESMVTRLAQVLDDNTEATNSIAFDVNYGGKYVTTIRIIANVNE